MSEMSEKSIEFAIAKPVQLKVMCPFCAWTNDIFPEKSTKGVCEDCGAEFEMEGEGNSVRHER